MPSPSSAAAARARSLVGGGFVLVRPCVGGEKERDAAAQLGWVYTGPFRLLDGSVCLYVFINFGVVV